MKGQESIREKQGRGKKQEPGSIQPKGAQITTTDELFVVLQENAKARGIDQLKGRVWETQLSPGSDV